MNEKQPINLIDAIISWSIIILVGIIPLFFLTITPGFYSFNKNFLLCFTVVILLFLWSIKAVSSKEIKIARTPLDLPILAFGLSYILSTIFVSPNKAASLLTPAATGTALALVFLYFLITNNLLPHLKKFLLISLITGTTLLGLLAVLQYVGLPQTVIHLDWIKSKLWTPAETPLDLITVLACLIPLALILFFQKFPVSLLSATGWGFSAIALSLGLIITLFQIIFVSKGSIQPLPYPTSWFVAIESFKQSPLFGVGPENFLSAFNRYRPASFNQYPFWNSPFFASANYPLHLLTTNGLLGFIAFLWLLFAFLKTLKAAGRNSFTFSLFFAFLLLLLLPPNFLLIFILFVLLALWAPQTPKTLSPQTGVTGIPIAITALLALATFYFGGRAYLAEIRFKKALDAIAANKGIETYDNQIKAIQLNPKSEDFRLAYSQTNIAIANSIANKKDLSDQDKANITQLVQQAIREAKIATVLNPTSSRNWENLAQIYRRLINFAQGAEQWSVAAYQPAIITNPANPWLRINLGGIYYSLGNYEQAARLFQDAVNLKPDYANAYYNLAVAYRELKKYPEAYQSLQSTLNLIPADSSDWQKARTELDELAKKIPELQQQATSSGQRSTKPEETLSEPEKGLPTPIIQPPITLPSLEPQPTSQP